MNNDFDVVEVNSEKYFYHIPTNSIISSITKQGQILNTFLQDKPTLNDYSNYEKQDLQAIASMLSLSDIQKNDEVKIRKIAIAPTMKCNINCTYCYNFQEGDYDSIRKLPNLNETTIDAIIEKLGQLPVDKNLNVSFIGGEPLLNINILENCIDRLTAFATDNEINLSYTITTNGLLLNRTNVVDFINKYKITTSVSLDGPSEWNDETRIDIKKEGTYWRVIKNLNTFFSLYHSNIRSVRSTPRLIPGRLIGTYLHLVELGFNDIAIGSADFETMSLKVLEKEMILEEVVTLCNKVEEDLIAGKLKRFSWFTDAFKNLFYGKVKSVVCGACRSYIAFDTYGKIQVCHRYLGNNLNEITVSDLQNIHTSERVQQTFSHGKTINCPTCKVRSLCGGECYHVAEEFKKAVDPIERQEFMCSYKRKMYSSIIKSYINISTKHPSLMEKLLN